MKHFSGVAAIASMQAKGLVIGPILEEQLPIRVVTALGIDTDALRTVKGGVARRYSAKEAAVEKARLALQHIPNANYGIGSEGSFGSSPYFPFAASRCEVIALLSRDESVQVFGCDVTEQTNYSEQIVKNVKDALECAERFGFPSHAVVVCILKNHKADLQSPIIRGITSPKQLVSEVEALLSQYDEICIQSDMRANYNPTRMLSIQRATYDLVKNIHSCCPNCSHPGYVFTETINGLPCKKCSKASDAIKALIYVCASCCHRETRPQDDGNVLEDSAHCGPCNLP